MAIKVNQLELTEPLRALRGTGRYERIRLLVRYHGTPLGWVWLNNPYRRSTFSVERLREEIDSQLSGELVRQVIGMSFEPASPEAELSPFSVVVCTRDRPDLLEGCLQALFQLDYPDYEIIVVDNAPSDDRAERIATALSVRYVREDRPGLDLARNRGLSESRGHFVAFADDDARPDRRWLRALARGFRDPTVMAVSGLVTAVELETRAQMLYEFELGGLTRSMARRTVRRSDVKASALLGSSLFIVGTNMAFRRSVFETEEDFDPVLDAGTPSAAGGDLEMGHRLVTNGHTLVYEPSALVWHVHRRTLHGLQRQVAANQTGFGCYLLTCIRRGPVGRLIVLRFALKEWLWGLLLKRLLRPGGLPRRLVWAQLRGALRSPAAYLTARKHARRIASRGRSEHSGVRLALDGAFTESDG